MKTKTNMMSRTLSVHIEHELLLKLETAGLSEELAQKVIISKGNDLATKVVRFINSGGFEPTTSQKRAREIMGSNFFGIEEAIRYFGVNPSHQQLAALSEIPFSEEVLQEVKDTHVLMAVLSLSVLEIRSKVERDLFCSHGDSWYNEKSFAKENGEVGWQMVRKTPVPESTSKNWEEQEMLITEDDEVPTFRVMTHVVIGHFLATGESLFGNVCVRTSFVDSDGFHVGVSFGSGGLLALSYWVGSRCDRLGLSSARKKKL